MNKDQTELVRPWWEHKKFHEDRLKDVTVLICQRKTKELITLCLESLLNFYPDINVLVVDGDSQDDSLLYLKFKSALYPNVKIWERTGINSHGMTMDEAIKGHIRTKYVLLMDSDVITVRGGWIEGLQDDMIMGSYATGALMLVTRSNYAIGEPKGEGDVLRYVHPSTGMYDVERYKKMAPFTDHGAPCVYNMLDAEKMGLTVSHYPVEMYVAHLSGASWCVPKPIWPHGFNVRPIPFLTVIADATEGLQESLYQQRYHWFDVIFVFQNDFKEEHVVMHLYGERDVNNPYYTNRMLVNGEYVCEITDDRATESFEEKFIGHIIENGPAEEFVIDGITITKRNRWQQGNALR